MTDQDLDLFGSGGADADDAPDEGADEPRRPRRRGRRVLLVLVSLLVLVLVAVAGFVGYLGWRVNDNVTQAELLPTAAPPTVDAEGDPIQVPASGNGTNFLLVGADSRGPNDRGRADVIVLVHVPADPTAIQMVHFPRDLYVSIPGHGKNKINAAYAFGGEPLLVETIQNLVGIKIDHVARTDFDGFKGMTDAVGGVRVYAEEGNDASGNGGKAIQKGWNELNGEQALAFVRERYELSEGDISRGRRQMAFVKALLLKATSKQTITNPLAIARFTDAATKNLVVDKGLSIGAMKDYALLLRHIRSSDVVFATAPFTGFGMDPVAGSIDIVDTKGMKLLGEALRKDQMDDYLDVFVTP
ncbi:LCP family protein [Phycicoccus sonneratiae]|uniref:LCP family protein n=1 Tax=Phycicoccus sonneratiae TaxID=2807628 RepID=A0ABS2CNR1_9MICO|nr:LCP family protein [Phycicoccus sonneraticus]MBM6401523.1 LCP family protein [Phycicoccus sonneraticus]